MSYAIIPVTYVILVTIAMFGIVVTLTVRGAM